MIVSMAAPPPPAPSSSRVSNLSLSSISLSLSLSQSLLFIAFLYFNPFTIPQSPFPRISSLSVILLIKSSLVSLHSLSVLSIYLSDPSPHSLSPQSFSLSYSSRPIPVYLSPPHPLFLFAQPRSPLVNFSLLLSLSLSLSSQFPSIFSPLFSLPFLSFPTYSLSHFPSLPPYILLTSLLFRLFLPSSPSLPPSLSVSLSSYTYPHSLSVSLLLHLPSLSPYLTHSLSYYTFPHSLSLSFSLITPSLTHSLSLSLSFSLSLS